MDSTSETNNRLLRSRSLRAGVLPLCIFFAGLPTLPAIAQDSKIEATVMERQRPELDALGLRLGTFQLFPKLGMGLMADSNIYASDDREVDDLIAMVEPELILKSNWSRNRLELGFDAVVARYNDVGTEDYDDWRIWGDTSIDVGRGEVSGLLRHADLHEPRTSADNRRGIEPTLYTSDELNVGYRHAFGRFSGSVEGRVRWLDYAETTTLAGSINNDDRDRQRNDLQLRLGHQTVPGLQPFIQLNLTTVDYDQPFDRNGFARSSDGFDLVGGTALDLSGHTFGEAYFGYTRREYDDPRFATVDGPIFGGQVTWNVTGLTTMVFSADRRIAGTTIENAAGVVNTGLGFSIDHELLRNLIVSVDVEANNEDFEGIDRDDDILRAGVEGIYMINRYLRFLFGYRYQTRDTSPADSGGFEYAINRFFVGVEGQL